MLFGLSSMKWFIWKGQQYSEDQSLSYVTFHNIWPSLMGRDSMIGFLSSMFWETSLQRGKGHVCPRHQPICISKLLNCPAVVIVSVPTGNLLCWSSSGPMMEKSSTGQPRGLSSKEWIWCHLSWSTSKVKSHPGSECGATGAGQEGRIPLLSPVA